MHLLLVNFNLKNLSDTDYRQACDQTFAPAFRDVPGLLSKIWLADPATNTYGGVYLWHDRAALEAFQQSDLFRAVTQHPHLANFIVRDFPVLAAPTLVTRGCPVGMLV